MLVSYFKNRNKSLQDRSCKILKLKTHAPFIWLITKNKKYVDR